MIRQVAPLILEAAGSMAKDAMRIYLERRMMQPDELSGSPYADLVRSTVMAHRYVMRSKEVPENSRLYQTLAQSELGDALYIARGLPRSNRHASLIRKLEDARALLTRHRADAEIDPVARLIWDASGDSLDLAE